MGGTKVSPGQPIRGSNTPSMTTPIAQSTRPAAALPRSHRAPTAKATRKAAGRATPHLTMAPKMITFAAVATAITAVAPSGQGRRQATGHTMKQRAGGGRQADGRAGVVDCAQSDRQIERTEPEGSGNIEHAELTDTPRGRPGKRPALAC